MIFPTLEKLPGNCRKFAQGQRTSGGSDIRIASTLPPVIRPNLRAAIVQQVELDVAAAPHELVLALGRRPRLVHVPAHQLADRRRGRPRRRRA